MTGVAPIKPDTERVEVSESTPAAEHPPSSRIRARRGCRSCNRRSEHRRRQRHRAPAVLSRRFRRHGSAAPHSTGRLPETPAAAVGPQGGKLVRVTQSPGRITTPLPARPFGIFWVRASCVPCAGLWPHARPNLRHPCVSRSRS